MENWHDRKCIQISHFIGHWYTLSSGTFHLAMYLCVTDTAGSAASFFANRLDMGNSQMFSLHQFPVI